mmetsp:Transcript_142763/g.455792  ORF Transcript_142763/g.455792 Transcript_142763/m.455792 type:complete len:284 (-) Transcript_142763:444-1295(-)
MCRPASFMSSAADFGPSTPVSSPRPTMPCTSASRSTVRPAAWPAGPPTRMPPSPRPTRGARARCCGRPRPSRGPRPAWSSWRRHRPRRGALARPRARCCRGAGAASGASPRWREAASTASASPPPPRPRRPRRRLRRRRHRRAPRTGRASSSCTWAPAGQMRTGGRVVWRPDCRPSWPACGRTPLACSTATLRSTRPKVRPSSARATTMPETSWKDCLVERTGRLPPRRGASSTEGSSVSWRRQTRPGRWKGWRCMALETIFAGCGNRWSLWAAGFSSWTAVA